MPLFTIQNAKYETLLTFSTDEQDSCKSFSVGSSPMCAVSLQDFPDVADSVQPLHFSVVRQDGVWHIVNPGNDVRTADGRQVENIEIRDGLELIFGRCRMPVEFHRTKAEYDLVWMLHGDSVITREPLLADSVLVGSAHYCDIIIESPQVAPEHVRIMQESGILNIEPANPVSVLKINGHKLQGKMRIMPDKLFFLDTLPVKIVPVDMEDSDIFLNEKSLHLKRLNFFLGILLAAVSIVAAWKIFTGKNADSANGQTVRTRPLSEKALIGEVKKYISAGSPDMAMEKIISAQSIFKDKKEYSSLLKAVSTETRAVWKLNFHKNKLDILRENMHRPAYLRELLSSPDTAGQIKLNIRLWNDVLKKFRNISTKVESVSVPVFSKYGISSFFTAALPKFEKMVVDTLDMYKDYLLIAEKWRDNRWKEVLSALDKIDSGLQKNAAAEFRNYIGKIRKIAEFAVRIRKVITKLSDSDIRDYNTEELRNTVKQCRDEIKTFRYFNDWKYRILTEKINMLAQAAEFAENLNVSLEKWENDRMNLKAFNQLISVLRKGDAISSEFPAVKKAADSVRGEISRFIFEQISEIKPGPYRALLEKCDKLENFIVATGAFSTAENAQKLADVRRKVTASLNKRCGELYEEYNEALSSGDKEKMKAAVLKLIETAPENSKYFTWAKKQSEQLK